MEYCPDTITAKILEMDARSQSEVSLEYRSLVFVCKGLIARSIVSVNQWFRSTVTVRPYGREGGPSEALNML